MLAVDLTRCHIGASVAFDAQTNDGPEAVAGLLRWLTFTSDHVILAVEDEDDSGAVEWTMPADADVEIRAVRGITA